MCCEGPNFGEVAWQDNHSRCDAPAPDLERANASEAVYAPKVICDGCNVRNPFEHRCHGDNAYVNGERMYAACQCECNGSIR